MLSKLPVGEHFRNYEFGYGTQHMGTSEIFVRDRKFCKPREASRLTGT